MRQYYVREF